MIPTDLAHYKKDKWIHLYRDKSYLRYCSICNKKCWYVGTGDYAFCPNCGERMMGNTDETD